MTPSRPPAGLSVDDGARSIRRAFGVRLLFDPGFQSVAVGLLLVVALAFRGVQFVAWTSSIQWGYDFSAYWQAARYLLDGEPLYSAHQLAGPYGPQQQFLYLYPPFLAVAVAPLAALFDDYRAAAWAWAAIGAAIVAAVVWALARSEGLWQGRRRWYLVAAAFALPPVVGELVMGNVHLVLLGLLAVAWLGYRRGGTAGDAVAGAAVGVAALIKIFPGLIVLWFLLVGRPRAAGWAVLVAGVLALATLPVTGIGPWLDYPVVLANLGPATDTTDTLAPTVWLGEFVGFTVARVAVTAVGLGLLGWSARRQSATLSFGVAVMVSVFVAPAVYHHYLALTVLPFLLALAHGVGWRWLVVAYLCLFGGDQPGLGAAAWIVNRLLPTLGALALLGGLLRAGAGGRAGAGSDAGSDAGRVPDSDAGRVPDRELLI